MKSGDLVARISYNMDIIFKIKAISQTSALLEGVYVRLIADSPISDLKLVEKDILERQDNVDALYEAKIIEKAKTKLGHITGKILHFDSDSEYLRKSLHLYEALGIYSFGVNICEEKISEEILNYTRMVRPNIIIITGHDSYNKRGIKDLDNYRNTQAFMKAVIEVRRYYSLDDICIFAGACGSNFEALIAAGANFASSCNRSNIEAYDPAIVGILASITPINQIINISDLYTFSKMEKGSIGGIESFGKLRLLTRT